MLVLCLMLSGTCDAKNYAGIIGLGLLAVYIYLIQKHSECKKRSGQELKKGQDEKELKSKWAAKAGVVLVLMRIKF